MTTEKIDQMRGSIVCEDGYYLTVILCMGGDCIVTDPSVIYIVLGQLQGPSL